MIGAAPKRGRRHYWRCRCECGTEREVAEASITSGKSKSCGCGKGPKPAPAPEGFKTCPSCLETKPLNADYFHVSRARRVGFVPRCKNCVLLARRAYYHANAEAEKARHGEWVRNNRERANAHAAKSRARNPERDKESQKRWRQRNRARILAKNRARKALIRRADRELYGDAELYEKWAEQQGGCFYCRVPLFGGYHVEHKTPLSRGGADKLANICLACPPCNLRKGTLTAEEFLALLAG